MRYLVMTGALLLGSSLLCSCVTNDQGYGYMKASGRTNLDRMRLVLAQCQGEASATPQSFWIEGGGLVGLTGSVVARVAQDQSVTSACMARHGYVAAPPPAQ
jgi:hypothetical protein